MNIEDTSRWKNLQVLVEAYRIAKDNYEGDIRELLSETEDAQVEELLRNLYLMTDVYRTCGGNLRELHLTLEQKLVIHERWNDHFTEEDAACLLEICKREDDEVKAKHEIMYTALNRIKNRERASKPRKPRRDPAIEAAVRAMLEKHPDKSAQWISIQLEAADPSIKVSEAAIRRIKKSVT